MIRPEVRLHRVRARSDDLLGLAVPEQEAPVPIRHHDTVGDALQDQLAQGMVAGQLGGALLDPPFEVPGELGEGLLAPFDLAGHVAEGLHQAADLRAVRHRHRDPIVAPGDARRGGRQDTQRARQPAHQDDDQDHRQRQQAGHADQALPAQGPTGQIGLHP